jgi:hypothetical protein
MVARVLGRESCLRLPREKPPAPEDIVRQTRRKIAFAGGLPSVNSLQYAMRTEGAVPGPPLIMGHAHLQRGGLNARIRSRHEAVVAARSRTVSSYLRPEYAERSARVVREFVNETLTTRSIAPQTMSFQAYLQFSMNFQLQSLYAYVRNWNPLIAPMVDERFALLCEDLATSRTGRLGTKKFHVMDDLRSERIAMGATHSLAPSLLEFPLAGDRYRCDGPDWENFALRDPGLVKPGPISREEIRATFNTRRTKPGVRAHLWEQIEGTVVKAWAEFTCRPEIWRYVTEPNSPVPEGENQVLINQFVWSLYGLSVILGSDWWSELAVDPAA